jgi:hypothetical protein
LRDRPPDRTQRPPELAIAEARELRGISDAAATCDGVIDRIERAASSVDLDEARNPDEIFERLGSG